MADWFLDAEAIDIHHQHPTEDGHAGVFAAGPDLHQFSIASVCSFFCSLKRANFKWYSKQNPKDINVKLDAITWQSFDVICAPDDCPVTAASVERMARYWMLLCARFSSQKYITK
jgi:hypothetical protein